MRGRAGRVTEDLGFCDRYLGNRNENFPIWAVQPGRRDETF